MSFLEIEMDLYCQCPFGWIEKSVFSGLTFSCPCSYSLEDLERMNQGVEIQSLSLAPRGPFVFETETGSQAGVWRPLFQ